MHASYQRACGHAHQASSSNHDVCLVATKQDLKFEQNQFIDTRDTGCAGVLRVCAKYVSACSRENKAVIKIMSAICREI